MRLSPPGSSLYVPLILLLSVIAVAVCNCLHMSIIIKVVFGNVNVKFAFPTEFQILARLYSCILKWWDR